MRRPELSQGGDRLAEPTIQRRSSSLCWHRYTPLEESQDTPPCSLTLNHHHTRPRAASRHRTHTPRRPCAQPAHAMSDAKVIHRVIRRIAGLAVASFFSEVHVIGGESVPKTGPIIA